MDVQLVDGDLQTFNRYVVGLELVAQRLRIRLGTFRGEILTRASAGLDILSWLEQKPPDAAAIGDLVLIEIQETPGVVRVEDFVSTFTPATQSLSFSGMVIARAGELQLEAAPYFSLFGNSHPALTIRGISGRVAR